MKVYLGAIAWRNYEAEFVKCLIALIKQHPNEIAFLPQVGDALVERSRSVVATHFLEKTDADVLLTIDSDITFEPSAAWEICEQAMTHDIVCGIYNCRSVKAAPASILGDEPIEFAFDNTPREIRWGATGFMAVHRRVLEKLSKRPDMEKVNAAADWGNFPFYHTMILDDPVGGRTLLSEDYAFCERAKEEGFKVYVNPAVRLGHIGQYVYRLEDIMTEPMPPTPMKFTREGLQRSGEPAIRYKIETPHAEAPAGAHDVRFRLDPEDQFISPQIAQTGRWEPHVLVALKKHLRPDDLFLDLGAHIGYFTVFASQMAKQVIAVEALPRVAEILNANVELNQAKNVEVHACAVTDFVGHGAMRLDPEYKHNPGASWFDSQGDGSFPVRCTTLANILQGRFPDVIKADIEGWEYAVFKDNPAVLEHARVVVFEHSPAQMERITPDAYSDDIFALFRDSGFDLFDADGEPIGTSGWPVGFEYANYIAVKQEQPVSRQQRRALARAGGK